jgi:molybdopterin converting factor small subunit
VLADVGKKSQAGDGLAARHPAAKVSALWRADLADDLAWRYACDSHAWGYAALRWLLVDPGGAVGPPGQLSASGGNVGMGDVARLRAATGQAAEVVSQSGAGPTRQALIRHLSTEADRLLHGRCSAQVNRELLAATAEATLLAGYLTYACWPLAALAQAYFVQALALAQACGDRQLGAATLCAMSQQAVFNGHLDEGRNLVSTALSGIRGTATPELSAHLRLVTARDHVHRNDLTSCVRALKDAVTEFDRAVPGGKPGWTRWLTEADPLLFALVLAAAYLAAGLPDPAHDTQLVVQQLADRTQSPCSASYISELEHRVPDHGPGARQRTARELLAAGTSAT